ncbi:hypothetical protein N0V90_004000 [Kalmusia sp. IMI 367209]|nr:hypothetical protein N0V90_004000 [Kalmusia sp. IMI 367209]
MWWESCARTHCGFWVNLDSEWGTRSTLTLPTQWGLILIAFLALFIRLAGSYLWSIICFVIHQSHASSANQDDTYHQIQLVLRNTDTEASLGWKLFRVGVAHKGSRVNAFNRTYWLIVLAMIHTAGIGALGGLSSRFIAGSDEVLAVSGNCGWMQEVLNPTAELQEPGKFDTFSALVVMARYGYRRSASYARSCYAQTSDNSSNACEIYTRPTIPYNTTESAPCPFDDKICNGLAITLDTGIIRSDIDLGINTLPESAVTLRQSMTCAPIAGDKYATGWGTADDLDLTPEQTNFVDAGWNATVSSGDKFQCYRLGTEKEDLHMKFMFCVTEKAIAYGDSAYEIQSATSFVNYNGFYAPTFEPIDELKVNDSDVTLISLINRITYPFQIGDPWFNSTTPVKAQSYNISGYTATNARSFVGCRQQYQLCTLDGSYCSPHTGVYDIPHEDEELAHLNPSQRAVFQLMWKMIWFTQLNFQLIFIGRENLIANDYLWDGGTQFGLSAALPDNHWQSEARNWFNTSLAALQRAAPTFARPPEFDVGNGLPILKYIKGPDNPEMEHLCHSIKMRSKAHTSFSVLGLSLLIGLGLFVMLLNMVLPKAVAYYQTRTGRGGYKRLEWVESNAFQLQRMAAEGRGVGPWMGKEDDVPVLVERGNFNLTGMSLRQKGGVMGGGNGYQVVRMGDEMELQDHGIVREGTIDRKDSERKLLDS